MGAILLGATYRKSTRVRRKQSISPTQTDGEIVEASEERLRKAVRELKNGKSCGPEGVYAELLKHGTDKLINILTWVINRYLNVEEAPLHWKLLTFHQYTTKEAKKIVLTTGAFQ